MALRDQIAIRSDAFEHRRVQPHFINPCCFGEDLATWLQAQLAHLATHGFAISEPIQEDYGWGLWAEKGKDSFWIALSYCGIGPTEEPAEWIVTVAYAAWLSFLRRPFHRVDKASFAVLRDTVWGALRTNPAIAILA